MDLPILILAAGQSARMRGVDKLLGTIDGVPVLARQIAAAQAVSSAVFVAIPSHAHPRAALAKRHGAQVLEITGAQEGVGATLREGIAALPDFPAFMIVLGDLVELTADDFQTVITARTNFPDHRIWRGATAAGRPGHPILFDASLRDAFRNLSGDQGGRDILKTQADQTHLVPLPSDRARLDLDTPEDWQAWRARTGKPD